MKKKFWIYMVIAFVGAWLLQILGSTVFSKYFTLTLSAAMFMPLLGVLVACGGLGTAKTGIGWKINFKSNWKYILFAWFAPAVLTIVGGVLYFVIFSKELDMNFGYLVKQLEVAGVTITDGKLQGVPINIVPLVTLFQLVSYAPLFNMLFALGEEVGWRGFMTPALQERFGMKKGLILAGIIWGIWHAPVIVLAGYEYGRGYWGAPVSGILLFAFIATAMAVIISFLYEKTNCIWVPALAHGAINAAASFPLMFTDGTKEGYPLGPAPNGLISGLPMVLLAVVIFVRMKDKAGNCETI